MPATKSQVLNEVDLDNPVVIQLIKKLLEQSVLDQNELFARLNEAQRPSQKFLRETEFTI